MKLLARLIVTLALYALFFVSTTSRAQADHQSWVAPLGGKNKIELTQAACTAKGVIAHLSKPGDAKMLKAAVLTWDGKTIAACWMQHPDQPFIFVVDETGDSGVIPLARFVKVARV